MTLSVNAYVEVAYTLREVAILDPSQRVDGFTAERKDKILIYHSDRRFASSWIVIQSSCQDHDVPLRQRLRGRRQHPPRGVHPGPLPERERIHRRKEGRCPQAASQAVRKRQKDVHFFHRKRK